MNIHIHVCIPIHSSYMIFPFPHPTSSSSHPPQCAFSVYCSVLQYFTAFKYHYPYIASDLIIIGLTPVCLQYITACYSVLQHVAARKSSPLSSPVFRMRLHHLFAHPNGCSMLQYVAVCCSTWQYLAVCMLQDTLCCSMLQ